LIELLLVTATASLLFVLLIQLFLQLSQTTFRLEHQAVRNEVVYFALTEMKRDIRWFRIISRGVSSSSSHTVLLESLIGLRYEHDLDFASANKTAVSCCWREVSL